MGERRRAKRSADGMFLVKEKTGTSAKDRWCRRPSADSVWLALDLEEVMTVRSSALAMIIQGNRKINLRTSSNITLKRKKRKHQINLGCPQGPRLVDNQDLSFSQGRILCEYPASTRSNLTTTR